MIGSSNPIRAVAVLAFVFGTLNQSTTAQEPNAGVVGSLSGDWRLSGASGSIQRGQSLPAGGKIFLAGPRRNSRGSHIEIYLLSGMMMSISCDRLDICERPISLPEASKSPPSFPERFWTLLKGLVSRSDRLASTLSRGDELQEAVVRLADGQVDLAPVFRKMKPGSYLLGFQPATNAGDSDRSAVVEIEFEWDLGRSLRLYAPRLRSGLWRLELLERSTPTHEPLGIDAWVLLATPVDHEKNQKAFLDVQSLIRKWDSASNPESARTFLRAYLEYLAPQASR